MSPEVCRQPVAAEGQIRYQAVTCEVCDGESDKGRGFSLSIYVSPSQRYLISVSQLLIDAQLPASICNLSNRQCKRKVIPLQARCGPEGG